MTTEPKVLVEDDIEACGGDQLLGVFMHKLYAWAENTKVGLTMIDGAAWIGCSTKRWITERKPWGQKAKVSQHQFERMLARGRRGGVLASCQSPSRFDDWKTVLHVRPTDEYHDRRTSAARRRMDAGPMRGFCRTSAGPMQDPDQDKRSRTVAETAIGVAAGADTEIARPARVSGEGHEACPCPNELRASPASSTARPPSIAATPMQLWKVWVEECAAQHDMKLERATQKQKGQLRRIIEQVQGSGFDPVTFTATVVGSWASLTRRIRQDTDDVQFIPDEPHLGFTTRFLGHLISAAQEEAARRADEARRDAERRARREEDEAARNAAIAARERADQRQLHDMADRGAQFATKDEAVAAMYACIGQQGPIQSVTGQAIRAFLSSWGGDEALTDNALQQKYRRELAQQQLASFEAEPSDDCVQHEFAPTAA